MRKVHTVARPHGAEPSGLSRRQLIRAGAWAAPVIVMATASPATAASGGPVLGMPPPPPPTVTCGGTSGNNGTYTVVGNTIVISYNKVPDIYEVNVRMLNGAQRSFGTNYGTAPVSGSLTWSIQLPAAPGWIQVHGFNAHYGEPSCPRP